ncbi:helix-turn-helix domain-containing protein [Flavobacterium davisii]|uniref:Helix-turn-helix domain-containing protein n=1 Tax=Flavobacterium columnare TaxID=996 RepID=A0A8G0KS37_9FLAO|nr:helix-turn-helix domain-containing protein [Flavobacterium davisii]QYS89093.1 helix-turn-helix domain-containing protein [Flavobacterium davisii]
MDGSILKENRKKYGLTQSDLGKLLGVAKRTIINYEKGEIIPDTKSELLHNIFSKLKAENSNSISKVNFEENEKNNFLKEKIEMLSEQVNILKDSNKELKEQLKYYKDLFTKSQNSSQIDIITNFNQEKESFLQKIELLYSTMSNYQKSNDESDSLMKKQINEIHMFISRDAFRESINSLPIKKTIER